MASFSRWCGFPVIANAATASARELGGVEVISRTLGARFLLDAMLRVSADAWRLNVELVDAEAGCCLASEVHDFTPDGLFAAQDRLCDAVVAATYERLIGALARPGPARHPEVLAAWELAHRGLNLQASREEQESNHGAREWLNIGPAGRADADRGHVPPQGNYDLAKYSWETYPDNAYFERYYLRSAFVRGNTAEAEKSANSILSKIDKGMAGYEGVSGRNAAYVLAYYYNNYHRDIPKAKEYYLQAVNYSIQAKAFTSGYYLSSLIALGKMSETEKDYEAAREYYKTVIDRGEKKSSQVKEAKDAISQLNKPRREERRKWRG